MAAEEDPTLGHGRKNLLWKVRGPEQRWAELDIPELIWRQAARHGDRTIVETEPLDDAGKEEAAAEGDGVVDQLTLTYLELQERATVLAGELSRRLSGISWDSPSAAPPTVAVCLQRSPALVVALLGILAAGAAYVPLEPSHPGARLQFILEDSTAQLLVTCWCARRRGLLPDHKLVRLTAVGGRLISTTNSEVVSDTAAAAAPLSASMAGVQPIPRTWSLEQPAYLLYTSGSTGRPKGVLVPRRSVLNVLHSFDSYVRGFEAAADSAEEEQDSKKALGVLVAVTTYCFDISVLEIFWPLCFGFGLFLASATTARIGTKLAQLVTRLASEQPHLILQGTPATFRSLLTARWRDDGDAEDPNSTQKQLTLICGGEAFPPALAPPLLKRTARVWNAYGPTETTIWSAAYRLTEEEKISEASSIPLGSPLFNTQLFLAEAEAEAEATQGETDTSHLEGDLLIGGQGLALGYFRRPELTTERYVQRGEILAEQGLSSKHKTEKVYRTGDLVRVTPSSHPPPAPPEDTPLGSQAAEESSKHSATAMSPESYRLEYLGRMDQQVKFRGFRVELGEIEAYLESHPSVQAAAAALATLEQVPMIIAFVQWTQQEAQTQDPGSKMLSDAFPATPSGLRAYLSSRLPAYMVPKQISAVDTLPLSTAGKVDRQTLVSEWCKQQPPPQPRRSEKSKNSTKNGVPRLHSGSTAAAAGDRAETAGATAATAAAAAAAAEGPGDALPVIEGTGSPQPPSQQNDRLEGRHFAAPSPSPPSPPSLASASASADEGKQQQQAEEEEENDEPALQMSVFKLIAEATGGDAEELLRSTKNIAKVPLVSLGLDSLSSLRLAELLAERLLRDRAEVSIELLLGDGDVEALCRHVRQLKHQIRTEESEQQ